ncbi:hypothetical protein HHJ81_00790 [Mobiluncus mulieris]|uniref:Uncharacterized protein n=1 Tax=Mobiluncus mulieris TaxID=2052 RepID=A0A848RJ39_9ACTO|nr:hypothetical protein [Mobiluncus mulieris]MBB5846446.1 hypothetical protein [Mobiluncus mulieris]NMW59653.1 hypothetical protein [Mobiluncus mulieris]NMW80745.1 hypothetical protein [Mobiluncus mulieris]NMW90360.1 hypothetical protein [Mobiluncus mulieris]NMW92782.1 hypothetical protein [Mobiluncus mulieris]
MESKTTRIATREPAHHARTAHRTAPCITPTPHHAHATHHTRSAAR